MNVAKYMDARTREIPVGADTTSPLHRTAVESDERQSEAAEPIFEPCDVGLLGLVELILKDRRKLERVVRDPVLKERLAPRFLAISLAGFTLFGVAMAIVFMGAGVWPRLSDIDVWLSHSEEPLIRFADSGRGVALVAPAFNLVIAYAVGLVAASCICLPSLYFFGLLSGVPLSMLDVTLHTLKAKAASAIALVGILPLYVAACMGMLIFGASTTFATPTLLLGLLLPFFAGLWGTRTLYVGFASICDVTSEPQRLRRACFLRRLVFSWCVLYTAVAPVMIHVLWANLQS